MATTTQRLQTTLTDTDDITRSAAFTTRLKDLAAWGQKNSLWPMTFGTACCGIELMSVMGPRYDLARFGAEVVRFSPRQADLLIVAGTVNHKIAPIVINVYEQMLEPKYVISMGACASSGGFYRAYNVLQGVDKIIPVDVYVPGCPPTPEAVLDGVMLLQKMIADQTPRPWKDNWKVPMKQLDEIRDDLTQKFAGQAFQYQEAYGNDVLVLPKDAIVPVLSHFKMTRRFDFLMDICGVDFPVRDKRFEVVYHLYSSKTSQRLRVKTSVAEGEAVDTVTPLWKGANWFEREAFDMYGIPFRGHPYLRKILTHHEFKGHPLRKDYQSDHEQYCATTTPMSFQDEGEPSENSNLVPLNIGPSHPATHGTLRIMAELDGETVQRANVEFGYLHRCFEKMAETHPYNQVIPYTDRLNYCSAPMNNIGYCKTVEKLLGVELPPKAQAMRVILAELSRVIDHLVCIGANALDLGALTGFFHLFTYREKVYTLFEKYCGARLTVSLTRIGGMAQDAPKGWFDEVLATVKDIRQGVDDLETLLTGNKIWIQRTQGVGAMTAEDAISWGYTGPCLRAAGVSLDLRKSDPYYGYDQLDFDVPIGTTGDVYDRYLVRVEEMRQSLRIVEQVCKNVPSGDYTIRDRAIVLPEKKDVYGNIEGLMNHFMLIVKGIRPPVGEIYDATEAANGELGFYLVSDGSAHPYRLKVRPPCFPIFQSLPASVSGGLVADVVAILGSMNVIAGELDR